MADQRDNFTSDIHTDQSNDMSDEPFAIIDESGEGFGFEITPENLMKPIAMGAGSLFGFGMLAGVPMGIAMGRTQEGNKGTKGSKFRPSFDGLKFAATTFGLGTLLCGTIGMAGFYGVKWYYNVETFEEFGKIMRKSVPEGRSRMENRMSPLLDGIRHSAGENLPDPVKRVQTRFEDSAFGRWIKAQVGKAVTIVDEEDLNKSANTEK